MASIKDLYQNHKVERWRKYLCSLPKGVISEEVTLVVDTQKILWQIKYNFFHLKKFLHKKFRSNKFEPPLKKICVTIADD